MQNSEYQKAPISRALLVFNTVLVLCIVLMSFVIYTSLKTEEIITEQKTEQQIASNPFNKLNIRAKSAYVIDVANNKVLYKKNEFIQLPLASVTKLMTALVASTILPEDSRVIIQKEFLQEEGDSGLLANESWKLQNLLDFSLVVSSNDGARSLASVAGAFDLKSSDYSLGRKDFIEKMNLKAMELGLKQTYFINESGLDEGSSSGGYGSAIDVANLLQYILKNNPRLLEATKYQSLKISSQTKVHTAKNTNLVIDAIPGLLASKTGFTDMAGGNLAIAFDSSIGRPIVVVVLGSTEDGRFDDVSSLVKTSLEYIQQ